MSRTLIFSFCEKRKSASCFLVGGDVVRRVKEEGRTGLFVDEIRMPIGEKRRKKTKKIVSLSLSLFIEEENSVCLSALSQGPLCPLLRANTRIFAREERERGRERERRRRKSESESERFILLLLCGEVQVSSIKERERRRRRRRRFIE